MYFTKCLKFYVYIQLNNILYYTRQNRQNGCTMRSVQRRTSLISSHCYCIADKKMNDVIVKMLQTDTFKRNQSRYTFPYGSITTILYYAQFYPKVSRFIENKQAHATQFQLYFTHHLFITANEYVGCCLLLCYHYYYTIFITCKDVKINNKWQASSNQVFDTFTCP